MKKVFALLAAIMLLGVGGIAQAETRYKLTPLGWLPDGWQSVAQSINKQGEVVGYCYVAGSGYSAFKWDAVRGMRSLVAPDGPRLSIAWGVNDSGATVGNASSSPHLGWCDEVFLWTKADGMSSLGAGMAWAVNNAGAIVGAPFSNYEPAVLWQPGLGWSNLDLPTGYIGAKAYDINNTGIIVGEANLGGPVHAVIWQDGEMNDLSAALGNYSSSARAINDAGQVIGVYGSNDDSFVWSQATGMLTTGIQSGVRDINNSGIAVGSVPNVGQWGYRAFVWTSASHSRWLNDLLDTSGTGWYLTQAEAVNESGQIVGYGINPSGNGEAYLLTPIVPEPSSIIALAGGLVAVVGMGRRRA